jgi:hypothetical protein
MGFRFTLISFQLGLRSIVHQRGEEKMSRTKRRSLKAYLVEPFKQIRFGLHVVGVSVVFVVVFAWLVLSAFREQYQQVIDIFQVAETGDLINNEVFIRNGTLIGSSLIIFTAVMMFVVIRRTHKMYGPMVSIMRFVGELQRGNFAVRIHIREKDDFQALVHKLNALAETLHTRYGVTSTENSEKTGLDALDARNRDMEDGVIVLSKPPSSVDKAS